MSRGYDLHKYLGYKCKVIDWVVTLNVLQIQPSFLKYRDRTLADSMSRGTIPLVSDLSMTEGLTGSSSTRHDLVKLEAGPTHKTLMGRLWEPIVASLLHNRC